MIKFIKLLAAVKKRSGIFARQPQIGMLDKMIRLQEARKRLARSLGPSRRRRRDYALVPA